MRSVLVLSLALTGAFAVSALAEETAPSADEARRSKVFAKVGMETITVGMVEDEINVRSPYARVRLAEPQALRALADDLVSGELFYQGAVKLGYADDPEVARFVDQAAVQLFIRKEFEEPVGPHDVPAEAVAEYFQAHPDEFRRPEMRRARHILVASRQEAQEILAQLKTEEKAFRDLAKERSLDTETNLRGGDLLYFHEDGTLVGKTDGPRVNAVLAKAAFSLGKRGDLSPPLELGDGKWSVLELTGIRPEKAQTFEEVKDGIRRKLWRQEREAALNELIAALRIELKPELHPERMEAVVLAPPERQTEQPSR